MSSFSMTAVKSLLQKEFFEHKTPFLYVPGIFILLIFGTFFISLWRHEDNLRFMGMLARPGEGIDLFNAFYSVSMVVWLGYLSLMLFVYFASSFSADRKNNALLFWKSIPISDLEILGTKTLAGLIVFPLVIMGWALVTAVFGYIILSAMSASSPILAALNSGTDLLTTLNVILSSLVFMAVALLWFLPIFTFVGMLGTLLRGWAVPAFVLLMVMISAIESILNFAIGGAISDMLANRFEAPFTIIAGMIETASDQVNEATIQVSDIVSVSNFAPNFLSQIDWTGMVLGWLFAAIFIYLASEYRRRRLAS